MSLGKEIRPIFKFADCWVPDLPLDPGGTVCKLPPVVDQSLIIRPSDQALSMYQPGSSKFENDIDHSTNFVQKACLTICCLVSIISISRKGKTKFSSPLASFAL